MIYVKNAQRLVILFYSIGVISSSLHATNGRYKSLTDAMQQGQKKDIQDIVRAPQTQERFQYGALDTKARDPNMYGKGPLHKATYYIGGNPNSALAKSNEYRNGVHYFLDAVKNIKGEQEVNRITNQQSRNKSNPYTDAAPPLHILAGYKEETPPKPPGTRKVAPKEKVETPKPRELADNAYRVFGNIKKYGANINAQDDQKMTPLHWAVRHKNERLVKLLLDDYRANANIVDKYGKLPLHWAASKGYTPILELLLQHTDPSFIDLKDQHDRTPLHWVQRSREGAVFYEDSPAHMPKDIALKNIKLLLRYGADPYIKDDVKKSAFDWANLEERQLFNLYPRR